MNNIALCSLEEEEYMAKEAYKELRTNLKFAGHDKKVINITSCVAGEGKSTVSLNLARELAEDNKKVVFVDADLRKSVLIGRYQIVNASAGLTHYLSGQKSLDEVLCSTNIENLDMILAGPITTRPSELLDDVLFEQAIATLREGYDYVLIDSPPMGSVIDAAIIEQRCDGVLLVLQSEKISPLLAQEVKKKIDKTGCELLGVVLNKVKRKEKNYYSYGVE